ncbi:septum formation initiator family protein [Desulforamulus putei]|uniref:FtsB family cell division protein n=1 Tax=Desulforamulus putei TaxID=74701 RepID=UPI002FDCE968
MISTGKGKVTELKLHRENKEQGGKIRRRSGRSKLVLILSVVVVAYVVFSLGNQFKKLQAMQSNMESLQSQVQELKSRNAALREEIKQIKSDSYVEQVAREQLGLVKPGETLVVQAQSQQENYKKPQPVPAKENKPQGEGFNVKYKNIYD